MGSAISNIELTRINLAGRNMQIRFYISGKDFFTMAQTNFTGGSDILADGDWRPKKIGKSDKIRYSFIETFKWPHFQN